MFRHVEEFGDLGSRRLNLTDFVSAPRKDLGLATIPIPVVGEFPLQSFPPGEYQLSIVVTDQSTKKSAWQLVTFTVQ